MNVRGKELVKRVSTSLFLKVREFISNSKNSEGLPTAKHFSCLKTIEKGIEVGNLKGVVVYASVISLSFIRTEDLVKMTASSIRYIRSVNNIACRSIAVLGTGLVLSKVSKSKLFHDDFTGSFKLICFLSSEECLFCERSDETWLNRSVLAD